jgi:hypothetical protein
LKTVSKLGASECGQMKSPAAGLLAAARYGLSCPGIEKGRSDFLDRPMFDALEKRLTCCDAAQGFVICPKINPPYGMS